MSVAKQFLRALIDLGKLNEWTGKGDLGPLFNQSEVDYAEFFAGHVAKYGKFPSVETFKSETGEDLPKADEPPGYYRDRLKNRYRETQLKRVMSEAGLLAKGGKTGWVDEAWSVVGQARLDLNALEHSANLLDFREAEKTVMTSYHVKQTGLDPGLMMGWDTLDDMSGGLRIGDAIAIAGRPGVGKTWAMLHAALYGWKLAEDDVESPGSPRLFISMEMDTIMVAQRLISMVTKLPFKHVKGGKLTQGMAGFQYETLKDGLKVLHGMKAPFWIMDGNLASTADEVAEIAVQLQPAACFIDAAYLLKHPTERDRYRRVAENADLIKKGVANAICPVVSSWQLKREEGKKKKKKQAAEGEIAADPADEVTLDDIGYSDAIGQVSSLVLGIFEGANPEEQDKRKVRVLKGRSGEVGGFLINWNFKTMNFDEFKKIKVEDTQVV